MQQRPRAAHSGKAGEGATLRAWQRGRSTDDLVEAYRQAGQRLAAAHAVGIMHDEFEREGTPGHCAPECVAGEAGDPASDQFAWCSSLYEALYGRTPYEPTAMAGALSLPARGRGGPVPRSVRRVLRRGLALAPTDRFPSMDSLLDSLVAPHRGSSLAMTVATIVLGIGVGVGAVVHAGLPAAPVETQASGDLPESRRGDETRRVESGTTVLAGIDAPRPAGE